MRVVRRLTLAAVVQLTGGSGGGGGNGSSLPQPSSCTQRETVNPVGSGIVGNDRSSRSLSPDAHQPGRL
jgi:hypothetical protein